MNSNNKLRPLQWVLPLLVMTYVQESLAGETTRASVDSSGNQTSNEYRGSYTPSISADGRFVTFTSDGLNSGLPQIYLRDRVAGKTSVISVDASGKKSSAFCDMSAISANARFVAFECSNGGIIDGVSWDKHIYLRDRATATTSLVSVNSVGKQGNDHSEWPSVSADGRFVAFESKARNLVAGDSNHLSDVFVHDRKTGKTVRASVGASGQQGNGESYFPAISADGRWVAFTSAADNLVDGDTNNSDDVFVHDLSTGVTERVSVDSAGAQSQGNNFSRFISSDGRFVAFESGAGNLVNGDTNSASDIFVRDRLLGATTRVSVNSAGKQANWFSIFSGMSADGRFVTFESAASNLVPGDTNLTDDIFIHDRLNGKTSLVSVDSSGMQSNGRSFFPVINADGRSVAFVSEADNLVAGDTNQQTDVFVRDRLLDVTRSADLQMEVIAKPDSAVKGKKAVYVFKISNNGPDSATNATLIDVVGQGKVLAMDADQGSCFAGAVSVCRLGDIAPGASATITAEIRATEDTLHQNVSVNASPLDNLPLNNRKTLATPVTP